MESIVDFGKWIRIMRSELEQQTIVLERLAIAFAGSDIKLIRYDQVTCLRILKSRITKEVEDIKQMESAAQSNANKNALLGAGAMFTIGSIFMAATRHKDAYKTGANLATLVLSKEVPFGAIFIVIGEKGIPEDVKTISVSCLARESNMKEADVKASLKDNGYLIITPEQFAELIDEVEQAVLDGSHSLPISVDALNLLIT